MLAPQEEGRRLHAPVTRDTSSTAKSKVGRVSPAAGPRFLFQDRGKRPDGPEGGGVGGIMDRTDEGEAQGVPRRAARPCWCALPAAQHACRHA